ncbi:MAG TPA: hypothetical protein VD835_16965, partial [Pyrinomonadaceae bacterium]|nr:hypothetical protein [Pyrinomonadaceae bacterium]
NADGALVKRSQFRDGKLEGVTIEYYPNGQVRTASQYKAHKLHGEVVSYSPEGIVVLRTYYIDGEPAPFPLPPPQA